MKEVQVIKDWYNRRDWFIERNIPWRRGLGVYGPGGTGKSSLARAFGQLFKIPVYQFFLNTMSDQEFIEFWNDMNTPCIALFEDFDNVFHGRTPCNPESRLNFDTILNCVSGIETSSGVLLMLTTNKIETIDPALGVESDNTSVSTRTGRLDKMIFLGPMNATNRRKMIAGILRDWPELIDDAVKATDGMTPPQTQEYSVKIALDVIHKQELGETHDSIKSAA